MHGGSLTSTLHAGERGGRRHARGAGRQSTWVAIAKHTRRTWRHLIGSTSGMQRRNSATDEHDGQQPRRASELPHAAERERGPGVAPPEFRPRERPIRGGGVALRRSVLAAEVAVRRGGREVSRGALASMTRGGSDVVGATPHAPSTEPRGIRVVTSCSLPSSSPGTHSSSITYEATALSCARPRRRCAKSSSGSCTTIPSSPGRRTG